MPAATVHSPAPAATPVAAPAPAPVAPPVAPAPSRWPDIERRAAAMVQPSPSVGLEKITPEYDSLGYATITEPNKKRFVAWARSNGGLPVRTSQSEEAAEQVSHWYVSAMAYADASKDARMPGALDYFAYRLRTEGVDFGEANAGFSVAAQLVSKGHGLPHPPNEAELQRALAIYALNLRAHIGPTVDAAIRAELLRFAEAMALDAPLELAAFTAFRTGQLATSSPEAATLRNKIMQDDIGLLGVVKQYNECLSAKKP